MYRLCGVGQVEDDQSGSHGARRIHAQKRVERAADPGQRRRVHAGVGVGGVKTAQRCRVGRRAEREERQRPTLIFGRDGQQGAVIRHLYVARRLGAVDDRAVHQHRRVGRDIPDENGVPRQRTALSPRRGVRIPVAHVELGGVPVFDGAVADLSHCGAVSGGRSGRTVGATSQRERHPRRDQQADDARDSGRSRVAHRLRHMGMDMGIPILGIPWCGSVATPYRPMRCIPSPILNRTPTETTHR